MGHAQGKSLPPIRGILYSCTGELVTHHHPSPPVALLGSPQPIGSKNNANSARDNRDQLGPTNTNDPPGSPVPLISIRALLDAPALYHQHIILVRGSVTRLELHLDDSKHFIDYVFWLKEGGHRLLVFGQHDRTMGDIQMMTDRKVEVRGLFWHERFVKGYRLENNLEARQVRFFPPIHPDRV